MNKEQLHRYIAGSSGNESNICQIYAIKYGRTVYDDWETFNTQADANKRRKQVEYEISNGKQMFVSSITLNEFLDEYIKIYGAHKWAPSTYKSNTALIETYIRPIIGDTTVLSIPTRIEKIGTENIKALYSVGLPAALSIFLFDVVTIALNKMIVEYGNIPLAAMGIALKVERLPMYIGLGIGNFIVHYMNAVGKGKVSLVLAVIRHLVLILPVMLIMNACFALNGLVWSQLIADVINTVVAFMIFRHVEKTIMRERTSAI